MRPHFERPEEEGEPLESVVLGRVCAQSVIDHTYEADEADEDVVPNIVFTEAAALLMGHAVALSYEVEKIEPSGRNMTRGTLLALETMLNHYLKANQYPLTVSVSLQS